MKTDGWVDRRIDTLVDRVRDEKIPRQEFCDSLYSQFYAHMYMTWQLVGRYRLLILVPLVQQPLKVRVRVRANVLLGPVGLGAVRRFFPGAK